MTVKLPFQPIILPLSNSTIDPLAFRRSSRYDTPTFKRLTAARMFDEHVRTHEETNPAMGSSGAAKPSLSSLYAERARAYMAAQEKEHKERNKSEEESQHATTSSQEDESAPHSAGLPLSTTMEALQDAQCEAASGVVDQEVEFELMREMSERLEMLAGGPSVDNGERNKGEMLIRLTHPLFEHTQLRVRIVEEHFVIDCECEAANEAEWFRAHVEDLSSRIGARLQRKIKMRVASDDGDKQ